MDTLTIALIIGIAVLAIVLGAPLAVFVRRSSALNERIKSGERDADAFEQGRLREQIEDLAALAKQFAEDARSLQSILTTNPFAAGDWSEEHVERVLQMAGLQKGVDYIAQPTIPGGRPDFVLMLPNGGKLYLDAKFPTTAHEEYRKASNDKERAVALLKLVQNIQKQIRDLANKKYGAGDPSAADFVVAVFPEGVLQLAIGHEPGLVEWAAKRGVVLVGHSALVGLAKAVALGWRTVKLSKNAEKIVRIGTGMYDSLMTFESHLDRVSKSLANATQASQKAQASFDSELLSQAREFRNLGI